MSLAFIAFFLGVIAGLRSMTAPAAASWAASLGYLRVGGTPLAFMGNAIASYILTFAALGELVADKLPKTPSRLKPAPFIGRAVLGALAGGTVGASGHQLIAGLGLGLLGAVAGTYGGAVARGKLAAAFGRDLPAAILEDVVTLGSAIAIVLFLKSASA